MTITWHIYLFGYLHSLEWSPEDVQLYIDLNESAENEQAYFLPSDHHLYVTNIYNGGEGYWSNSDKEKDQLL